MSENKLSESTSGNNATPPVSGSVFKMQGKLWKVKTDGDNGWVGVECQDHNRAFTSERIEDVQRYLSEQHCR